MNLKEKIISEYLNTCKNYLNKITEFKEIIPQNINYTNTLFNSQSEYQNFKKESLNELVAQIKKIIAQLEKYNLFKTLNGKIIRLVINNNLTNAKFYDYAISDYNYRDIEPQLFEIINFNAKHLSQLSRKLRELKINNE
ncbi:hypothetical protein FF125_08265 [Aureibaculum algae]|uniref:Uncharacterized protein n=1 Tax=Aureibaculum algae TaxID=2584122 RepID=A0A5B7TT67_9FLAO|nr:hypothetical protein [Aureibaculum algae]QCX38424.1 hypothetical protein FF125_08265 [Aureibaculum algae]